MPSLERRLLLRDACSILTPALFLDRDGVIIQDRHHIRDPEHVELCPGARTLIRVATEAGWPVVVVTNQSGIARGLLTWADYERVTNRMLTLLGPAASIAAIYANGHGPDAPPSSWRKPSPVMLLDAASTLHLDLHRSVLVGDRLSDLKAGISAELAAVFHVRTGHGEEERSSVRSWNEHVPSAAAHDSHAGRSAVHLLETLEGFPHELLRPSQSQPA